MASAVQNSYGGSSPAHLECDTNLASAAEVNSVNSWNGNYFYKNSRSMFFNKRPQIVCNKYLLAMSAVIFLVSVTFLTISIMKYRTKHTVQNVCLKPHCVQTAARLLSSMDTTVDPCTDFYSFACGKWKHRHTIPAGRDSISYLAILSNGLETKIESMLRFPIDSHDNEATKKAKLFYRSCSAEQNHTAVVKQLNTVIDDLGGWPLMDSNWISANDSLEKLITKVKRTYGINVIFDYWIESDLRNASDKIIKLELTGSRTRLHGNIQSIVRHYRSQFDLMVNAAGLLGANRSHAERQMPKLLRFQMQLAQALTVSRSSPSKRIKLHDLSKYIPEIVWKDLITSSDNTERSETIELMGFEEVKDFAIVLKSTDISVIFDYVVWKVVEQLLPFLSRPFLDIRGRFQSKSNSAEQEKERWRLCVKFAASKMGLAVASLFTKKHAFEESRKQVSSMVENIQSTLLDAIGENNWMDEETKFKSRLRIKSMKYVVGYPEITTNTRGLVDFYSNLVIKRNNLVENIVKLNTFAPSEDSDSYIGWSSSPVSLNAFYDSVNNKVVLPVGMIQPPFFYPLNVRSINYGGIGVIIGHEIIHGFDKEILRKEEYGSSLWSKPTLQRFERMSKCAIKRYKDLMKNKVGKQRIKLTIHTRRENVADEIGIYLAFNAYKKWIERHQEETFLPGISLNHKQLFFLNYAQIWCENRRPGSYASKRTAAHSPNELRVTGPLMNSEAFAQAYGCSATSKMNPRTKCKLW